MWVSLHGRWNSDVQPFEKFLTELIIQRCDYTESISNKYRTTNGYIQVKELIRLCNLTFKRSRSVKSLKILIEEATSPLIKQNIAHDVVIDKYFVSLKKFIREYPRDALIGERNSPSLEALHKLLHALKIFEAQLDRYYFSALKKEFLSFDYVSEEKFQTKAETLSALVDLLIPYLIFHGYSVASINEVLISWVVRGYRPTARRIFDFFHFKKRPFYFLQFLGEPSPETDAFLNLLRTDLQTEITTVKASELASNFLTEHGIPANRLFASYVVETLDPHNHVRNTYDRLLKRLVMRRERKSLAAFNDFFNNSFWSHRPLRNMKPIALREDAINVSSRGRTLFTTVKKCALSYGYTFSTEADIPIVANHTLRNAIYYYNLALASKSIENSLSLLWTALETIIPYRTMGSDIECVQEFICKSLGSGAISRDVYAFATRFIQSNQNNSHMLSSLGTMEFEALPSPKGLHQWFMWMYDDSVATQHFNLVKRTSELLAFQYASLGMRYAKQSLDHLKRRIDISMASMKYQLQRIYLHRNQIVHAGDFISEYTNLWMHLEWYVGKLLSYFLIHLHLVPKFESLDDAYRDIEAQHDYLMYYLELNRSHKVKELAPRIRDLLFEHAWRSF